MEIVAALMVSLLCLVKVYGAIAGESSIELILWSLGTTAVGKCTLTSI